jgi:tRNA(Arg) A34 adenosine deaminase TadA
MTLAVVLQLPEWLPDLVRGREPTIDVEAQMQLAIDLALANVEHGSGGPFGAAIFDHRGRLVGAGVNRVVPLNCSLAHAEMMAFSFAQHRVGRFRLNGDGHRYTLATSAQPCAMCFGGTLWAGIDRILIGARGEDVERLTEFDEGPLPADWVAELENRKIEVQRDLLRERACQVFERYNARAGTFY